jgi:hypothetical protein
MRTLAILPLALMYLVSFPTWGETKDEQLMAVKELLTKA